MLQRNISRMVILSWFWRAKSMDREALEIGRLKGPSCWWDFIHPLMFLQNHILRHLCITQLLGLKNRHSGREIDGCYLGQDDQFLSGSNTDGRKTSFKYISRLIRAILSACDALCEKEVCLSVLNVHVVYFSLFKILYWCTVDNVTLIKQKATWVTYCKERCFLYSLS